jgi:hypothetical protein
MGRTLELQRLAAALANLGRFLALADDAGLLKEAPAAHFAQDAVTLHDFVEPFECGFKRFIVVNYYACQNNHPSLLSTSIIP